MANQFATNYPIGGASNCFSAIWKLTRVMKAAGWIVKASSNGAYWQTTGLDGYDLWGNNSNPLLDMYTTASAANVNSINLGMYTTMASGTNFTNVATFTGSGTLTVNSTANFPPTGALMVSTTTGNQIVTYTGLGSGGTTFTGCNCAGTGTLFSSQTVSLGPFTTVTVASNGNSITAGTLNVTNTTGFPSSGTFYVYTSNGMQSVQYTGLTGNTLTGCTTSGSGTVLTGNYLNVPSLSFDNQFAWIVLSGPQSIKIPINSNPTGTFLRGEIVTQSGTNATGELLGYVWDSVSGTGWTSIIPQTGQFNCVQANTITGNSSGATMSPLLNGTYKVWMREVCFWKMGGTAQFNSFPQQTGQYWYICADGLDGYGTGPAATTVTSSSNNVNTNTFNGSGTLNVVSTTGFPSAGTLTAQTLQGTITITYTGTSGGNSFTGCTAIGYPPQNAPILITGTVIMIATTVASGSNTAAVSSLSTLSVTSTTGFTAPGSLLLQSSAGYQSISYTGISGNTFTGCTVNYQSTTGQQWIASYGYTPNYGTLTTGNYVYPAGYESGQLWSALSTIVGPSTYITGASNYTTGYNLNAGNITVNSTTGFPTGLGEIQWLTSNAGWQVSRYNGTNTGTSFVQNYNGTGQTVASTSYTVTSGPCASIPPGLFGFGYQGAVIHGGVTFYSYPSWFGNAYNSASWQQNAQMACVNAVPSAGVSPDGSFYLCIGYQTDAYSLMGFQRLDDTEPGDVDPWSFITPGTGTAWYNYNGYYTTIQNGIFNANQYSTAANWFSGTNTQGLVVGYLSRGNPNSYFDSNAVAYNPAPIYNIHNGNNFVIAVGGIAAPMRVVNHPATTKPLMMEPITLAYPSSSGQAMMKGRMRWVFFGPSGNWGTTFANKTLFCAAPYQSATAPSVVIGPWDGVTSPLY